MTVMKYNRDRVNQGLKELSFPAGSPDHPRAKCWTLIYIDEEFGQDERPNDDPTAFDGEKEVEVNWDIVLPQPMDVDEDETAAIATSEFFQNLCFSPLLASPRISQTSTSIYRQRTRTSPEEFFTVPFK